MYFIAESDKTFEQAASDLDAAVKRNGFGVLHVHDLGATLRSKGVEFAEQCKVFEVCNPVQAAKVMAADMRLNMGESIICPCCSVCRWSGRGARARTRSMASMATRLASSPFVCV